MFDLSSVTPKNNDENKAPLPDGEYTVVCSDALLKDTKAGTGKYIQATFTIKAGAHKGEKIVEFFNVENPNPEAARIGKEGIINFLRSSTYTGDYKFESFEDAAVEMCGLMVRVKTKIEASKKPEFGPRAKIRKFIPQTTAAPTTGEEIPF